MRFQRFTIVNHKNQVYKFYLISNRAKKIKKKNSGMEESDLPGIKTDYKAIIIKQKATIL